MILAVLLTTVSFVWNRVQHLVNILNEWMYLQYLAEYKVFSKQSINID